MIDPANVPDVGSDELLARFVLFGSHIRSDDSLKPDAFIPAPRVELSVTRHLCATQAEIWDVGRSVAASRERTLHGRGDVRADVCQARKLRVRAAPIVGNPNHADIVDWPSQKPEQKLIAQELAARATFVRHG